MKFHQAQSVWLWSNYLQSVCPPGRTLALLNTMRPVCNWNYRSPRDMYVIGPTAVMYKEFQWAETHPCPLGGPATWLQQVTVRSSRDCSPQVLLVGEKQVREVRCETIQRTASEGIQVWRLPTAWMNAMLMKRYLRLQGTCLRDFRETHRFVLYLDAHKLHLTPAVLRVASLMGLWICVIPSKMMWVMQPCDTHLFAVYRCMLGKGLQRTSGAAADGTTSRELVLETMWRVVASLWKNKDWSYCIRCSRSGRSATGIIQADQK